MSNRIRYSGIDRIFNIINTVLLTLLAFIFAAPIINIFALSFSSSSAIGAGKVWFWPIGFNLDGYVFVLKYNAVLTGYMNSLIYMVCSTLFGVAITFLAAYPLSRKDFPGRKFFMVLYTFTMLFSGGLIPSYLLIQKLGLIDSRLVMILTGAGAMSVIITRTFIMSNVPNDILDAARIDGANDFQFAGQIALPLCGAILAVMALQNAVTNWNGYMTALIYLRTPSKFSLQIILRNILILNQTAEMDMNIRDTVEFNRIRDLLRYVLIVISSIPMLLLYPFLQRYFVKGLMIGSLKE
jgi:putative aldouronate transport system permease protein